MKSNDIAKVLSKKIDPKLCDDLLNEFIQMKFEVATNTFGRSSAGKFVETVVQTLQFLNFGTYDNKPEVDKFLNSLDSSPSKLDDSLRICCARIARACYTLRNKRNILHKGDVDPNIFDLKFCFHSAQWILSELIRHATAETMQSCGNLIAFIQLPVHELVEEIGDKKIVHGSLPLEDEILVLLHSYYPNAASRLEIGRALDRRASGSISNALAKLWKKKIIEKVESGSFQLTLPGFNKAQKIIADFQSKPIST